MLSNQTAAIEELAMRQEVTTTTREVFPIKLAKQVKSQFTEFARTDMAEFTFEKTRSEFYSAKRDLSVYNGAGTMVLHGRDFGDRIFFWQA
jgi:hypothetical protein